MLSIQTNQVHFQGRTRKQQEIQVSHQPKIPVNCQSEVSFNGRLNGLFKKCVIKPCQAFCAFVEDGKIGRRPTKKETAAYLLRKDARHRKMPLTSTRAEIKHHDTEVQKEWEEINRKDPLTLFLGKIFKK